jgi:hypothetical protein
MGKPVEQSESNVFIGIMRFGRPRKEKGETINGGGERGETPLLLTTATRAGTADGRRVPVPPRLQGVLTQTMLHKLDGDSSASLNRK